MAFTLSLVSENLKYTSTTVLTNRISSAGGFFAQKKQSWLKAFSHFRENLNHRGAKRIRNPLFLFLKYFCIKRRRRGAFGVVLWVGRRPSQREFTNVLGVDKSRGKLPLNAVMVDIKALLNLICDDDRLVHKLRYTDSAKRSQYRQVGRVANDRLVQCSQTCCLPVIA